MHRWREWKRQRALRRFAIADDMWAGAVNSEPCLTALAPAEHARLRETATLFLGRQTFYGAGGHTVTASQATRIAAVASLLVLNLDLDWLRECRSIVVYAEGFVARHRHRNEDGLVHETEEGLSGEAWEKGPVVLSWADIAAGEARAGYNVVLHEFAHKIDMLNGVANGSPPLHSDLPQAAWVNAFEDCFRDLRRRLQHGQPLPVDAYAAEAPEECFAVLTEAFFECPFHLSHAYPPVYTQLRAFYRQDPAARADTERESTR